MTYLWVESRLADLESTDPEIRFAGEAYFDSLEPEAASQVIAAYDAMGTGCLEILVMVVAGTFGFVASELKDFHYLLPGDKSLIHVVIMTASAMFLVVCERKNRDRSRILTRAIFCLRGDRALNAVMLWLRNARASSNKELKQLALKSLAIRIEESNGILPGVSSDNRHYIHYYAKKFLRKNYMALDGEVAFRMSVVKWSSNLFAPKQVAQLLAVARKTERYGAGSLPRS